MLEKIVLFLEAFDLGSFPNEDGYKKILNPKL